MDISDQASVGDQGVRRRQMRTSEEKRRIAEEMLVAAIARKARLERQPVVRLAPLAQAWIAGAVPRAGITAASQGDDADAIAGSQVIANAATIWQKVDYFWAPSHAGLYPSVRQWIVRTLLMSRASMHAIFTPHTSILT